MAGTETTRIEVDRVDAASLALGRAMGLAYMVSGVGDGASREDAPHVKRSLQHIGELVRETADAFKGGPAATQAVIDQARSVCYVAAKDCVTEHADGDAGMHWNDEITTWAFGAVCEAIARAKAAVDSSEVSHG
jgi:hypothetical protein